MRILLVDDDAALCDALCAHLHRDGYGCDCCGDGETGLDYARLNAYECIILDVMLPRMDGVSLLRALRAEGVQTPVLLLTALGEADDRIAGLDAGADDYLVKPFHTGELLARIRALLRRPARMEEKADCLAAGDLALDAGERILRCGASQIRLSKTEAALLRLLMLYQNRVLTRDFIYARVWGPDGDTQEHMIDNYIHFLRRRLRALSSRCAIQTIRSAGYRFEAPQ